MKTFLFSYCYAPKAGQQEDHDLRLVFTHPLAIRG